jgi:hypothetical protein
MAPNPRKRTAPDPCSYSIISKSPRLSNSGTRPVSPDQRNGANVVGQPSRSRVSLPPTQDRATQDDTVAYRPVIKPRPTSSTQPANSTGSSRGTEPRCPTSGATSISGTPSASLPTPILPFKPRVLYQPHPQSKLCQDFHWVPYPLGLMPRDSWRYLHHREDVQTSSPFRCPVCGQERKATAHMRKVFLVAERLSWDDKIVSIHDKNLNEELNWKVNYELGILDPFIEDPDQVPGGKHSRNNKYYPYQNEHEMKLALKLIFMTEDITETSWILWISSNLSLQKMLFESETEAPPLIVSKCTSTPSGHATVSATSVRSHTPEAIETIDLTESPKHPLKEAHREFSGLPTPPWPLPKATQDITQHKSGLASAAQSAPRAGSSQELFHPKRIRSYKSLQDFYSLLDKIERTSYVGALFLEAYAERLRDDMCKSCWLKHNINLDLF